ncbi:MAG: hypothetical protein Q4F65_07345 [Propionibacteriaceae bacterium]|nr:hypothetical protein [Propionibacteriaceae bacterium]
MADAGPGEWIVSRRSGWRVLWGALGVLVFGAATVAAVVGFVRAPHIDSGVLVLIAAPFLVMAVVLAVEAIGQGLIHLDATGYRTPLGERRGWGDVLALGTGFVEGRETPVVALRNGHGVSQDVFPGFADAEAPRLVAALGDRVQPAGFSGLDLGVGWWDQVEAEADRAAAVVRATAGRDPLSRERVEFGYPGLVNAIRLDYGTNDDGERVELLVRQSTDLALTASGRRWLRQHRKRSADPATQVGWLFEPHTTEVDAVKGGFDRLVVRAEGRKPLPFNAEEPDRFSA